MKKIGSRFFIGLTVVVVLATPHELKAGGLSTHLGEAVIENLQIGQTYNLKNLANLRLIVTNTSDYAVDLKMDVLLPGSSELKNGAIPIPDTSWVKLSQNFFTLGPNEKASSDIIISIPDDDRYLGKKYQVMIWSHTVGGKAMFLAYGLKSRIILTTDTVKADDGEAITSSDATVNFRLSPQEMFLDDVELGKVYDVEERAGLILKIANPGDREQVFKLQSRTVANSVATLTKEYNDAPDATYLSFSESEFVLPPNGNKLNFPPKREYSGNRYMFIIHAYSAGEKITTGVYSRLYASIR